MLDGEVVRIADNFLVVRHESAWLGLQRTRQTASATWPNGDRPVQIHLDVAVEDLQRAVERAAGPAPRKRLPATPEAGQTGTDEP
jgi:hypothetical protein